jgi:hypothetical protein
MVMRSTLSVLPDVNTLRRKAQALAVLDAIMSPDWQYRYYSFNSQWDRNEMMASRKKEKTIRFGLGFLIGFR